MRLCPNELTVFVHSLDLDDENLCACALYFIPMVSQMMMEMSTHSDIPH